jgi:signal transduction histidine kinase
VCSSDLIASKDGMGIGAESTPGQGAEFRIAIPAVGAECTLATAARDHQSQA